MVRNTAVVLDQRASLALLYAVSLFLSAQFGAEIGRFGRWVYRHLAREVRREHTVPSYLAGPALPLDVVGFGPPSAPTTLGSAMSEVAEDAEADRESDIGVTADVHVSEASAA